MSMEYFSISLCLPQFLSEEFYSFEGIDPLHNFLIHSSFNGHRVSSTIWLMWTLLLETAPFIEETVFFPVDSLSCFVEYQLTIEQRAHFWIFYSIPLIYVSVLVPVPHCLDDHSFVVQPEIRHCDAPGSGFLFQYSPGYSGSFLIPFKS